jgi:aromatic-L-amino-acid/L-tryptophan decarboxylase
VLNSSRSLPDVGTDPAKLIDRATELLFDHSLFNSHPRFWGYITASAAPIGILGDLLASAVNPNTGAWFLSPMASEIEAQTIRWIAELLGFSIHCGGLMISGGNMANIVCLLAARRAKSGWDIVSLPFVMFLLM